MIDKKMLIHDNYLKSVHRRISHAHRELEHQKRHQNVGSVIVLPTRKGQGKLRISVEKLAYQI